MKKIGITLLLSTVILATQVTDTEAAEVKSGGKTVYNLNQSLHCKTPTETKYFSNFKKLKEIFEQYMNKYEGANKPSVKPPVTEKPTTPPVTEKPTTPPVTEKPTTPPVTEKPTTPPVTEKPTTPPVTEKPTTPPVTERPTTPPVTEKPTTPPVTEKPTTPPVTEKPTTPPVTEKPTTPPVTEKPTTPPVTEKPTTPPVTEKPSTGESNVSAIEQAVLQYTNEERAKEGLKPLQTDSKLMGAAREKSTDMATKKYFSHTSPTFGSPFDRMKALGISYKSAAENIAMGQRSAKEVVDAWMKSPGHRKNIMTPNFTHIGIGYDTNGHYWTQQFIQK